MTGIIANEMAGMNNMIAWNDTDESSTSFYIGGFLNPFDAALCALILCGTFTTLTWEENYGDIESKNIDHPNTRGFTRTLKNALTTTLRNSDILVCGLVSALFEGSMYVFVFMWTPMLTALTEKDSPSGEVNLPFGLIFASFMVNCMIGSSLFSIVIEKMRVEKLGIYVLFVGSLSMLAIFVASTDTSSFIAMNVFEICVGMYFPIMGTMKSSIVPESQRAAIYNIYRVPLNFIVLASLLTNLPPNVAFLVNTIMLATASFLQMKLKHSRMASSPGALESV